MLVANTAQAILNTQQMWITQGLRDLVILPSNRGDTCRNHREFQKTVSPLLIHL